MLKLIKDLGMLYPNKSSKTKKHYAQYECDCGNQFKAMLSNVKRGNTINYWIRMAHQ